jgi:hypothetical protein
MPRPQFTLRALLVAMLVVAAFFGGMAWQRHEWLTPLLKAEAMNDALQQENEVLRTQLRDCEVSLYFEQRKTEIERREHREEPNRVPAFQAP